MSDNASNAFAVAMNKIGYGQLSEDASAALAEVVKAVKETGAKGSITIAIEIKPRSRDSGQVEISGEVKPKIPQASVAPVMLFADADGNLHSENPAQAKLDLKFVTKSAANE